jgi:hypothetical protein
VEAVLAFPMLKRNSENPNAQVRERDRLCPLSTTPEYNRDENLTAYISLIFCFTEPWLHVTFFTVGAMVGNWLPKYESVGGDINELRQERVCHPW